MQGGSSTVVAALPGSRLSLVAAACGPGRPELLRCLAGIGGQEAGRAEITVSREGAKPRSSDERRTIFRQSPRAASVEPFLGKGHLWPQSSSARAGPPARARSGGREARSGLKARQFFRALDFGNCGISPYAKPKPLSDKRDGIESV